MLVLTRNIGQSIMIGDDIKITAMNSTNRNEIRIGIEAPENVKILREELFKKDKEFKEKENKK